MFGKILVGVDDSESSKLALSYALKIAQRFCSELFVLSVIPDVNKIFSAERTTLGLDKWEQTLRETHMKILKKAEEKMLEHPTIKHKTILKRGKASSIILKSAKDKDVDLIIFGSHCVHGFVGKPRWSTIKLVTEICNVPVFIVK
jgi:nucleotide-binding universal stress UspA family protein